MKGCIYLFAMLIGLIVFCQNECVVVSVKGNVIIIEQNKLVEKGMKISMNEKLKFSSSEDALAVIHPKKGRLIIKAKSSTDLTKSEFIEVLKDTYNPKKVHAKTAFMKFPEEEFMRMAAMEERERLATARAEQELARIDAERIAASEMANQQKSKHLLEDPKGIFLMKMCSDFEEADVVSDELYILGYKFVRVGYYSPRSAYCILIDRFDSIENAERALKETQLDTLNLGFEVISVGQE